MGSIEKMSPKMVFGHELLIFFFLDFTIGSGILPGQSHTLLSTQRLISIALVPACAGLAGLTAGQDLHLALKTNCG